MLQIFTHQDDHIEPVIIDVTSASNPPLPDIAPPWIDILNPSPDEDRYVENVTGVSIPTREEMLEIEASSRLYNENGAAFMTVNLVVNIDTETPVLSPITFVLKGNTLVTVRYANPLPFTMFIARAKHAGSIACTSGDQIMMGLLEAIVDRIADALEHVGMKFDAISKNVFQRNETGSSSGQKPRTRDYQRTIFDIGQEGDRLSMIRESLVTITRVLTYHNAMSDQGKRAQKEAHQRLRTLQRDAASLTEHSAYLTGKVTFLLDATLGLINLEQNQIIKLFSIVAVCLMPPTLIASMYGMNFSFMPELQWQYGYPTVLGMMIVSAIMPFVYFKRKGWL